MKKILMNVLYYLALLGGAGVIGFLWGKLIQFVFRNVDLD